MLRFGVLGPLEVRDGEGSPVDVGGRQPRTLLAVLLAGGARTVSVDAIVDAIWGDDVPASATNTLQSYVSRLRRRFGGDGGLRWDDTGYRLDVEADAVDAVRFERLADAGRAALESGDPATARDVLVEALALWRGPAFEEVADRPFASAAAVRLEERRLVALEDRLAADLALGRHAAAAAELGELVVEHPLREGLRHKLALALYRSGRQADALRALASAATTLREELGIEPSRPLRDLEAAILAHDPALDLPAASVTAVAAAGRSGLVGRDDELQVLLDALRAATTDARFVVVEGDAGIGKTRIVDELRATAASQGSIAVWGRSDESGATPSLWPWLAPLHAVVAHLDAEAVPPRVADLLAGVVSTESGLSPGVRIELFEAIAHALTAAGAAAPVVVLLDDLQWADATSLQLLAHLAGRLERGVLVVGTVRTLDVGRSDAVTDALATVARRPGSRRIQLRGLDADATTELLASTVGAGLDDVVAAAVYDRAEGNPFYAIELARLIGDEGGLADEVPRQVGDVIRRRLAQLPATTAELLGVAAVTGRDVNLDLLARAAGRDLDAVVDELDVAMSHRVLVTAPENPTVLRFSHALVREVLLDDMTALRRARLHLRVADAIEAAGTGVDDAEVLAEHLWRAAPVGVGRRAAEALERAAEVAVRRFSYPAAQDLLLKAVQLRRASDASRADDEAELLAICHLIEVARAQTYYQAAVALDVIPRAKELADRSGRLDLLLQLLWVEWSALVTSAQLGPAEPLARQLLAIADRVDDPIHKAQAIEPSGVMAWQFGRITEAVDLLGQARELRRHEPTPVSFDLAAEQHLVGASIALLNFAIAGVAGPDDIRRRVAELIDGQHDPFGVVSILGFGALTTLLVGMWDDSAAMVRRAREADPERRFAFYATWTALLAVVDLARTGDVDEALARYEGARADYLAVAGRTSLTAAQATFALHLADAGRAEEAARYAAEARAFVEVDGDRWVLPLFLMAEGAAAAAGGDHATADARFDEAATLATEQGSRVFAERAHALAARHRQH